MKVEKRRIFIINFVYVLILAALSFVVLKFGLPLLSPFVVGFVIAYILQGPIRLFSDGFDIDRKKVAVLITAVFFGTIGLVIALLGIKTVSWIRSFIEFMPQLYDVHIKPLVSEVFVGLEQAAMTDDAAVFGLISDWETRIVSSLGNWVTDLSVGAMGAISGLVTFLPSFVIKLILMIISTFFIAADYDKLVGACMSKLGSRAKVVFQEIKNYLIGTLFVCIRSYLLIMTITFIELSVALTIIGLEHALHIAVLTAVCDILPVLGTGTVMIPWAIISAVSGRTLLAVQLLIIYLIITVIRNIIEPKIVGSQLGLHPVVTLASMFAGVQLFGVVGMFGFPIGLSLLRYLVDNGTISLFKTAQEAENAE